MCGCSFTKSTFCIFLQNIASKNFEERSLNNQAFFCLSHIFYLNQNCKIACEVLTKTRIPKNQRIGPLFTQSVTRHTKA